MATHHRSPRTVILVNAVLAAAAVLLAMGIFAPLLTLRQLFVFTDTVSLASALGLLLEQGYVALFTLLLCFSILFPAAKLALLCYLWNGRCYDQARWHRLSQWLERLGKWSMLDVFVVALLVVAVKLQVIADAQLRIGIYAFAASIVLTLAVAGPIVRGGSGVDDR